MKRYISVVMIALTVSTIAACKKFSGQAASQESYESSMAMMAAPAMKMAEEARPVPADSSAEDTGPSVVSERKVIYTAELRLEIKNFDEAVEKIISLAKEKGGFVADSHVDVDTNGVRSGSVRLRVPSEKFNDIISGIKGVGKVKYEAEHGQDITEEYFDLETRLANSKKMEERLLDLLEKQTKSVKDLLEVEKELGRVREDIETKQGRKRFLDDRLSLSTITVDLFEPHTYTSSVFDPLKDAWSSIWGNLIASFAAVVSFIFSALPWAILIGFVVWIGIKLVRRWLKRRKNEQ